VQPNNKDLKIIDYYATECNWETAKIEIGAAFKFKE
jgi:hypothetical protein